MAVVRCRRLGAPVRSLAGATSVLGRFRRTKVAYLDQIAAVAGGYERMNGRWSLLERLDRYPKSGVRGGVVG